MKNKKNHIITLICISTFLFTGLKTSVAQDSNVMKENFKYEIAMDIIPFFNAPPYNWEGHFKIFNIKNNAYLGAYRVGLTSSSYNYLTFPDAEDRGKNHYVQFGLSLGYEKYVELSNTKFYFGADVAGYFNLQRHVPVDVNDHRLQTFEFTPFIGVRKQIIDCLAAAFEIGWSNTVRFDKDLDPRYPSNKSITYQSRIRIPYSLTINYKF